MLMLLYSYGIYKHHQLLNKPKKMGLPIQTQEAPFTKSGHRPVIMEGTIYKV